MKKTRAGIAHPRFSHAERGPCGGVLRTRPRSKSLEKTNFLPSSNTNLQANSHFLASRAYRLFRPPRVDRIQFELNNFSPHHRNNFGGSVLMLELEQQLNTRRSAVRMLLFILAIIVVAAGVSARAEAQNYPWCADYAGFGSQNCGFTTFQQCLAALSGNGGFCNANTQYVSPAVPAPRDRKRS
jgi:hypothetical protein